MPSVVNTDQIELNGVFNPSLPGFFFTRIIDSSYVIHHIELIDGKYFFFSRRYSDPPGSGWAGVVEGEIYWVDASVIFDLNKE